ncbi:sodium/proton-translocating pyrophosphatase [Flammeovirgaceae bacterium SG7u.111]|nr:sodium/proton-translocating pyrophosphatase [Flammeovirgaceae bacterium SG7u.132]WPO35450.1 sodium/proton-translocating pyrophosphatase [Flammeovirgaceae bacterium SG7u.111]
MLNQKSKEKINTFFSNQYKPVLILFFALTTIYITKSYFNATGTQLIQYGALVGFSQMFLVRLLGNLILLKTKKGQIHKWVGVLFAPRPGYSLGMLFVSILAFTVLFLNAGVTYWNVFLLNYLLFSFLAGSALATLVYEVFGFKIKDLHINYQLDPDRYDAFSGALIATIYLGLSYLQLPETASPLQYQGAILLPLVFALVSLMITYLGAIFFELNINKSEYIKPFVSVISSALLIYAAIKLVPYFLPFNWLNEGVEFTALQVLMAMQVGILVGLVSGKAVKAYSYLAQKYIDFLLNKPFKGLIVNISLRFVINGVLALLPLFFVLSGLMFSYSLAGIYGLTLSFLCMVSNVGVSLIILRNYLNPKRLENISHRQKMKLERVSPNFKKLLMKWFKVSN